MSESEHIRGVRRSKTLQRQQFSRFSGDILVGQNRSGVISDVLSVGRQVCREEQQGFKGGKRQFGGGWQSSDGSVQEGGTVDVDQNQNTVKSCVVISNR